MTSDNTRVAICVITFKRSRLLHALLDGLSRLRFEKVRPPEIQIVVVDNDKLASAEHVCCAVLVPWPIRYVVEPRQGITYARNRGIVTVDPADFIALIDDDEIPAANWLDELLLAQSQFKADVVSGPVLPKYASDVAEWVRKGGFFNERIAETGTIRRACAANNVLVGTHVFKKVPWFDNAFALSGAEDTNFFLRVWQAGYKIVWSQEAVVYEDVSAKRATVSWLLRRNYQTGNGWVFSEAALDNRLRSRAFRFSKALGHIAVGSAAAIWRSARFDKIDTVRSLQRVCLGAGMLAGIAGHRFLAYRHPAKPSITQME